MTRAKNPPSLRPVLPGEAPRLAALFRASVETLAEDFYDDDQRAAWAACAADESGFAKRLGANLTIVALIDGEIAGFAALKDARILDMLYVHPGYARLGVGSALADALERLGAARGAEIISVDASDAARAFFEKRGYIPQSRNTVVINGEWLGNTTMTKALAPPVASGHASMTKHRLSLFDTTLRDGAQTTGVDFSLDDKRRIAAMLDDLGVDYIEGGYPGANPQDTEFFAKRPPLRARFAAFGMTRRQGRSVENDPGVAALLDCDSDAIVFVAKAWDYQVRVALRSTEEDNLAAITQSVQAAIKRGKEAAVDCEHFFDGFKANEAYALACAKAAADAGARWIVLCDTNGGSLPHEIERIVTRLARVIPGEKLGVHAHDDTGQAVANSLAAVRAGARQIQGSLNGLGERCGNANLTTIIPTLLLKDEFSQNFEIGVTAEKLTQLTRVSHALDELLNRAPNRHAPYVGASAFATKAGIHASAVMTDSRTYEHVPPESVGNRRRVLVSDQAGRSNILAELSRLGVNLEKDDPRLTRLLDEVKDKEAQGYAYEGADASFFLLAKRVMGETPHYFDVERYSVAVDRRFARDGGFEDAGAEAIVKLRVHGETRISAAEGNGPVNALDLALRKDLGSYQRYIEDVRLVDYRVRVFQGGTDAVTRVLVECADGEGGRWSTVGVSANVIDASFEALVDAIVYKLLREGAV